MSATFSSVQARVTSRLIDMPAAILAEVPLLVNDAYKKLQKKHNFKVMEAQLAAITAVGVRTLTTLPADFKEWRGKPFCINNFGVTWNLVWAPNITALNGAFGYTDPGFPQVLRVPEETTSGAGTIEVWPLPDANSDYTDGAYRVYIPYIKYLADLSSPTDTSWLLNAGELYVIHQATAAGFASNWDEQRSVFWKGYANEEYADVIRADKTLRLSTVTEFVPYTGAASSHIGGGDTWARG